MARYHSSALGALSSYFFLPLDLLGVVGAGALLPLLPGPGLLGGEEALLLDLEVRDDREVREVEVAELAHAPISGGVEAAWPLA